MSLLSHGDEFVIDPEGFLLSAPKGLQNETYAQSVFRDALDQVKTAAEQRLGTKTRIGVIAHPEHFNRSSQISLYQALGEFEPTFKWWQVQHVRLLTALGSTPNACMRLERRESPPRLNIPYYNTLIINVNYNLHRAEVYV